MKSVYPIAFFLSRNSAAPLWHGVHLAGNKIALSTFPGAFVTMFGMAAIRRMRWPRDIAMFYDPALSATSLMNVTEAMAVAAANEMNDGPEAAG